MVVLRRDIAFGGTLVLTYMVNQVVFGDFEMHQINQIIQNGVMLADDVRC